MIGGKHQRVEVHLSVNFGGHMTPEQKQRFISLEARHKELDENIAWGYSFYLDDKDMKKMKFEKLQVKRELESLKALP